jgi:hypothetical protein
MARERFNRERLRHQASGVARRVDLLDSDSLFVVLAPCTLAQRGSASPSSD